MSNEISSQAAKGLFAGKARTVAAVAAFSGLALATTVSVQAAENASEQTPAAAVSEAPASETTVSAKPAAKAEKTEQKTAPAAKAVKAQPAAGAPVQASVVQAAPVADVTPLQAPAAPVQAPAAPKVVTAAQNVAPVAEQAPAAPVQAPAAPKVVTAAQNVAPVAEQAPVQGRHAAQPSPQTLAKETAAQQSTQVYSPEVPATRVQPVHQGTPRNAAAVTQATAASDTGTVTPQSSGAVRTTPAKAAHVSASGQGQAILGAAEAQVGVNQDCTALVSNSLRAVGINHHGWPASYKSLGAPVSASDARAGDIAYYANGGSGMPHVAIYAGNGQAIHGGWNGNETVKGSAYVGSGPEFIRVG